MRRQRAARGSTWHHALPAPSSTESPQLDHISFAREELLATASGGGPAMTPTNGTAGCAMPAWASTADSHQSAGRRPYVFGSFLPSVTFNIASCDQGTSGLRPQFFFPRAHRLIKVPRGNGHLAIRDRRVRRNAREAPEGTPTSRPLLFPLGHKIGAIYLAKKSARRLSPGASFFLPSCAPCECVAATPHKESQRVYAKSDVGVAVAIRRKTKHSLFF